MTDFMSNSALASKTAAVRAPDASIGVDKDELREDSPLQKIRRTELLPELFGLLLDIDQGKMQAKDFDNNLGTVRLKIVTLILRLQDIEGICDSIKDQELRIQSLTESKRTKTELIGEFRKQVLLRLNPET